MRFEHQLNSGITFYCELDGKQENNLFVVRFDYGRIENDTTDLQFHEEVYEFTTPEEMRSTFAELKEYCFTRGFIKVKTKKRNVIT